MIKKDFKPKLFGISNETIRFNKNYAEYVQNQKEFEKQLKIFNFIKHLADTVNERSIIEEISENAQQNEIMEPIIPGTPSINRLLHGKNPSALKPVKKPINNILPPPSFSTENALKEDKDETK